MPCVPIRTDVLVSENLTVPILGERWGLKLVSAKRPVRIVNLTDLRAFLGHADVSKSLIVSFGTCSFHDKYKKFCVKLTIP